jgi:hypothetical protein
VRESKIEAYLRRRVKEVGGLCYKWVCPGESGVPDRIVMYRGKVWVVETKTHNGKLSDLQAYQAKKILQQGVNYMVVDSVEKVNTLVRLLLQ